MIKDALYPYDIMSCTKEREKKMKNIKNKKKYWLYYYKSVNLLLNIFII